ncbi:MAG: asparagine synthase (glutamine-hydrolyzing) [Planctomycetota bacterium]
MCGIAGILDRNAAHPVDEGLMRAMLGALRHRGPDQFGIYLKQGEQCSVGLGSTRLSIIDLAGGQQPICSEDQTVWVVFNGEIFNYIELRERLDKLGHRLATDSDTEVIVHLFEEYGPDCVEHLNGQFALALWDERAAELFVARDRCGIRPLHYTHSNGRFLFASEIKALLAHPLVSAKLDPVALDQIFTFWSPLSPRTAFEGINTLSPGHWMIVRPDGHVRIQRYWQIDFPAARSEPCDDIDRAATSLRELLVDATCLRLRADVPVGAYLSGGLDSSVIAALVRRYTGNRLETFSIAFSDSAYDESSFQRQMADHLGTNHHLVSCDSADIGRVFPEVIRHTETPILRTSPAPLYLLSQLVRDEQFKVVLTGEGADEFLAGYNLFKEAKVRQFWARQPDSKWRPALLERLYPYIGNLRGQNAAYLRKFFGQRLERTADPFYSHDIRWRNTAHTRRLFSGLLRERIAECFEGADGDDGFDHLDQIRLPDGFDRFSPLARAQYLEATSFLPEYLLSSQGDRMAMAHSVEGRFPFLDHRVVELCRAMSPRVKLCGLDEKHVLKRAVEDLLPESVWRRKKQPYRAPIHPAFFPDGKPLEWVVEAISPTALEASGCFDPRAVAMLVRKIARFGSLGETDDMALAGVLSTQLVHRLFVDEYHAPPPLGEGDDIKIVNRTELSTEDTQECISTPTS